MEQKALPIAKKLELMEQSRKQIDDAAVMQFTEWTYDGTSASIALTFTHLRTADLVEHKARLCGYASKAYDTSDNKYMVIVSVNANLLPPGTRVQ